MNHYFDLVIIGGGPAGLAAGIEAKKNGIEKVLIVERESNAGGILPQCIHNGFGSVVFKKDLPGPLYASKFIDEAYNLGVEILTDAMVLDITTSKKVYISSLKKGYFELQSKAIVLAMGCRERTRAQIKLPGSRPAGIFTAGTIQRLINIEGYMPGKKAVILGSGDIGMIVARRLALEGAEVLKVIEALPFLTGLRRNYVQCLQDFNIPLFLSKTISNIFGDKRVEGVEISDIDSSLNIINGKKEIIECDTLVLSVGLIPENELSRKILIDIDPVSNGPFTDDRAETNIRGIFACGNVVNIYDLVDYVTIAGYNAGFYASCFIKDFLNYDNKRIEVEKDDNVYTVMPNFINLSDFIKDDFNLQFRVNKIFDEPVEVQISSEGNIIFIHNEKYARPAEMISLSLSKKNLLTKMSDNCKSLKVSVVKK